MSDISPSHLEVPSDKPSTPRDAPVRRTLDDLAWALGALAMGWLAQGLFAHGHLVAGLLLYAVAIPIFVVALTRNAKKKHWSNGSRQPAPLESLPSQPRQVDPGIQSKIGVTLSIAGVVLSLLALRLFTLETQNGIAWSFYVFSLVFFAIGVWLVDGVSREQGLQTQEPGKQGQSSAHVSTLRFPHSLIPSSPDWLLIAILLVALFFRLFNFFSLPFGTWFDEAEAGIQAYHILSNSFFRPVFWEPINLPGHLLYLFALSFWMFGVSTPALRVIPVLFGLGGVIFAYLFGSQWKGRRWGLLLAFLVATMRWHVNFSRIAMTGIDTPSFEFAMLYFGLRALRTKRRMFFAWTGLTLGLGLCFYGAFRLFVATLVLSAILWVLGTRGWRRISNPRSSILTLSVLLVAAWLVVMPIAQFAWRYNESFWRRTQMVSIFESREEPNLKRALAQNTQKHLLMFNYKGDNNGRHNLPGAPTLDRLSAVLFALGLGLAIVNFQRPPLKGHLSTGKSQPADELDLWTHRFLVLLLPVGLLGGILSLDFEAPQSLRSIATLPAVVYLVALSLDALWLELRWTARIVRPRYSLIAVTLGLGVIATSNATTYFGKQAHDFAVWQAFSTAETLVGKRMAELGTEPTYYLSPLFGDHPSIRFHTLGLELPPERRKVFQLPDPLPARESPDHSVVYFIHPDESWVFDWARQMYLSGWFETIPANTDFPPALFVVQLEPKDVASLQGLDVRYRPGDDLENSAAPIATDRMSVVDARWPDNAPLDHPFAAEWNGVLYAPEYGMYRLIFEGPDRVMLTLDGETFEAADRLNVQIVLAQGNHGLGLRATSGRGWVAFSWQPPVGESGIVPQWALYSFPVSGHGLLGTYYPTPNWQGAPAMQRVDPTLNIYFHLTPLPRPYSVEWTGALDVPYSGIYSLGLRSVDGARLYLDGQLVVEAVEPDEYVGTSLALQNGLHDLRITYQDLTARSRIHLYWTRPGGEMEILPTQYLWPSRQAQSGQAQAPPAADQPPAPVELPSMDLAWMATWGEPGKSEGQFSEPRDVAVMGDTVFVADTGNRRVQAFGQDGTFRQAWRGGEESFEEPLALGVDSQNRLLVLDSLPGWIYRFDETGEAVDRFAGPSSQTFHPRGMAVLADDSVIVADTGGARLVFFGPAGNMAGRLGTLGGAPGQLSEPTDVAVDGDGVYYVVESPNQRIQRLDRWGNSLGEWTIPPSVAYDGPHMAWSPDGSLLATAPEDGAILRYAPDGRLLNRWTEAGTQPLSRPVGIYVDAGTDTLYVTDTATHQVHLYKIE